MPQTIQIPFLRDHHSHPLFYSAFQQAISLESVKTKQAALESIAENQAERNSALTIAHGWRSNFYDWTDDELESLPPIAIFNVSLHSSVINQAGQQILRSRYGEIINNLDNRDWYERNLRTVLNWFANLNASVELLQSFYDSMLEQGVYYLEEMLLVDENEITLFEQAGLIERTKFWAAPDTFHSLTEQAKAQVEGLKLFTDGAIGSRTAAVTRPFLDQDHDQPNYGMLIYSDLEFASEVARCAKTAKSLAIHAIGDRAIAQVITILEKAGNLADQFPEIRIEHAQLISRDLAARAKSLGITLCMQPNFSADSDDYSDRLDAEYCDVNNPFRMLIDDVGYVAGEDLIFGSDGMPHGVEFAAAQAFSPTRPQQRLTLDEFVAGYCMDDDSMGTIELEIS